MTTSQDRRIMEPTRARMIRRLHSQGQPSSHIAQRYGVHRSSILQFVQRHDLDADYVKLSHLSRELNLDSGTLTRMANAGRVAQARKRGKFWVIHKSDVNTVLIRFARARVTDPTGLLSTRAVALMFGVAESTLAQEYFRTQWLSKIRRYKFGHAWMYNPGDTLKAVGNFREKGFLKKRVMEYLKLEGSATAIEIARALEHNQQSVRAVLKAARIRGLAQTSVYNKRVWKLSRKALEGVSA